MSDRLEEIWNIVKKDSLASSRIGWPSNDTRQKLESYIDTRENKARIDELLYLTNHADPLVLDRVWIQNRIKAIQQEGQ